MVSFGKQDDKPGKEPGSVVVQSVEESKSDSNSSNRMISEAPQKINFGSKAQQNLPRWAQSIVESGASEGAVIKQDGKPEVNEKEHEMNMQ